MVKQGFFRGILMEDAAVSRQTGANLETWLKKSAAVRRFLVIYKICTVFLPLVFTKRGLFSKEGRQQIRGKARRSFISLYPPLARKLQAKHGLSGGCTSCGASCNLMFQCPHWNPTTRLCGEYEDRPVVCRLFPITPTDISDRTIVRKDVGCGFTFRT